MSSRIRLDVRGEPEVVFYGPITRVAERPVQSNGQFAVALSTLRRLSSE